MKAGQRLSTFLALVALLGACSGSGTDNDATNPGTTPGTTVPTVQVGNPEPPLPAEINSIPYKPGDLVGLGNAQVSIGEPTVDDHTFSFDVTITSGSLNPFSISTDMFRVYTVNGMSYLPEANGANPPFGDYTLEPGESVTGTMVVTLDGDSEPAMFVADMSTSGERVMPGAWVFDPSFNPADPEG